MSETRRKFTERFGEAEARCVEAAARMHRTADISDLARQVRLETETLYGRQQDATDETGDQFLLDVATCISWECAWDEGYREYHGFKVPKEELRDWVRLYAVPPPEYRDPAMPHLYREYLGEE